LSQTYNYRVNEAIEHGINGAIFINYVRGFILKNRAEGQLYEDDRTWCYHSYEGISKIHPYWTVRQIGTIVKRLQKAEVLMVKRKGYDATNWFAFVDEDRFLTIIPNGILETTKRYSPSYQTVDCTIYNKEYIKSNKKDDLLSASIDYFIGRGCDPVEATDLSHGFIDWHSENGNALTVSKFKAKASTWLRNARRYGHVQTKEKILSKAEFGEMMTTLKGQNKEINHNEWELKNDMWHYTPLTK